MYLKLTLDILTATSTIAAVVVALYAVNRSSKNSREQILTDKLEELFELIKNSARYYSTLKSLYNDVKNLRDTDYTDVQTIEQYNVIRDRKFSFNERENLRNMLSRIEVLAKCYTKGKIQEQILRYEDLIFVLLEIVKNTGSLSETLQWKNGFPTFEEFHEMLKDLEIKIVSKITSRK